MAPTLRNSTRQKTIASTKAATDAGHGRKQRGSLSRRQRYTHNKGLVSWKKSMDLDSITLANATNSPLLCLPAEIRNMSFKLASSTRDGWIALYYKNSKGLLVEYTSHRKDKNALNHAETATLNYSENCFGFETLYSMSKWLSLRIRAQREVMVRLILPTCEVVHQEVDEGKDVVGEIRKICPSIAELEEDDDLVGECLCAWYDLRIHPHYD